MRHEISVSKEDTLLISFSDGSLSLEITAEELKEKLSGKADKSYTPKGVPNAKEEIKKGKK